MVRGARETLDDGAHGFLIVDGEGDDVGVADDEPFGRGWEQRVAG